MWLGHLWPKGDLIDGNFAAASCFFRALRTCSRSNANIRNRQRSVSANILYIIWIFYIADIERKVHTQGEREDFLSEQSTSYLCCLRNHICSIAFSINNSVSHISQRGSLQHNQQHESASNNNINGNYREHNHNWSGRADVY